MCEKTIAEKMKLFMKKQNITLYAAETATGKKGTGYFAKLKNPGADYLVTFLDVYPQLSAEWLFRGNGPMLIDSDSSATVAEEPAQNYLPAATKTEETAAHPLHHLSSETINMLLDTIAKQNAIIQEQNITISKLVAKMP